MFRSSSGRPLLRLEVVTAELGTVSCDSEVAQKSVRRFRPWELTAGFVDTPEAD